MQASACFPPCFSLLFILYQEFNLLTPMILLIFQSGLIVVLFSCQYLGLFLNRVDHKFSGHEEKEFSTWYCPQYTRPGHDPGGVGNNSEIYSDTVMRNIYIIKFNSSYF